MNVIVNISDLIEFSQKKNVEFRVLAPINLYDAPQCDRLATQADRDRHLQLIDPPLSQNVPETAPAALRVELVEDGYPGWLAFADVAQLEVATQPYRHQPLEREAIAARLPAVLAFAQAAKAVPNEYLWGGTVAPNYDCSGLMQAAFRSQGIWLPRDAYQQEAFVEAIALHGDENTPNPDAPAPAISAPEAVDCTSLEAGDLIFFGPPKKATHVGLYLGQTPEGYGQYLHSSGKDIGRNGIAVDELRGDAQAHPVSRAYFQQFRGAGRILKSYDSRARLGA